MTPLPDKGARQRIRTDHDTNLVCLAVAAGAAPVGCMAAITFTRKAAGELRGRFFRRLNQAADEASGTARAHLRVAVEQIDQCFIGTIHALCARLLRERPLEAGLFPGFNEIEEREELGLLRAGWVGFVQERSASGDDQLVLFEELGQSLEQLYPFFVRRCQFSDLPLKQAAVERPDLDPPVEEVVSLVNEVQPHIRDPPDEPDRFMRLAAGSRHLVQYGGELKDGDKAHLLTQFHSRSATGVTLKRWQDQAFARHVRDDLLVGLRLHIDPVLRQWRQYLYGLIAAFTDEAMRWYRSQRIAAGTLTFQDLLELSANLLRSNAEVRDYFQRRYRVVFVDEFQDTDPLQAQILLYLTGTNRSEQDWRSSTPRPGSLFVVGDEKQSIYRFRRADVEVFRLARQCVSASGGQTIDLSTSFRAVPPLVDWLNAAFGPLFARHDQQFQAEFTNLHAARELSSNGHPEAFAADSVFKITHEKTQGNRRAVVAQRDGERIVDFIAAAVHGESEGMSASAGDFMIVTRTTAMLSGYARCLEARGVAYDIVGTGSLRQSAELRALVEMLECVYRPENPVALIAYLRGSLVGLGDDELYDFRHGGGGDWSFRAPLPASLPDELRARLQSAFARLRSASQWLLGMTASAAIERLVDDTGLTAFAAAGEAGSSRAGNLLRLLALIRDFQSRRGMDWGRITQQLRSMMEDPDYRIEEMCLDSGREDVVRIINVHQAKGLESKVVFLADPADTSPRQFGAQFHVSRTGDQPFLSMPVANKRFNMRPQLIAEPPGWEEDEALEQQFEEAEEIRLLYVAATRASDILVVSTYEANSKPGPWAALVPALNQVAELPVSSVVPKSGEPEPNGDGAGKMEETKESLDQLRARRLQSWDQIREPSYRLRAVSDHDSELTPSPRAGRSDHGKEFGILVHRLFEHAVRGSLPEDEKAYAIQSASSQMPDELIDEAMEALGRLRESTLWRELTESDAVYTEVPLGVAGEGRDDSVVRGVIDLVYRVAGGGWKIVDYKTDGVDADAGSIDEIKARYSTQVASYARYWERISGERVAATGLWSTQQGYASI